MRSVLPLLLLVPLASNGQTAPAPAQSQTSPAQAPPGQALVTRALAAELRCAQDQSHPMRYTLRKTTPRLTTTKEIVETPEGAVARLLSIGDKPLSAEDEQKEQARLDGLLSDPSLQRHRKQGEDQDTERAMKVLRALPEAFAYQFASFDQNGVVAKFTFKPNPAFNPPDLESETLTQMTGEIWIDTARERVTRLEGHLRQDVDFGWGILGRLDKGGWIVIEQSDVGGGQWRIRRFQMAMTGRVLFKAKSFDTVQDETGFAPVPAGLGYQKAIAMLRAADAVPGPGNR
jgi:hypothetical protein